MDHALIGVLVFALIVLVLVAVAVAVIDRTLPGDIQWIAKVVVGVIGVIAVLYRLLPLTGAG